jgi:hypothetical protein
MRTNLAIAALIYPMVQAVMFGAGLLGLLVAHAPAQAFPVMIAATFAVSVPLALVLAPRLRSAWSRRHVPPLRPVGSAH